MSLINIPQKAFNLITDKKKRDNQIVRALSQVVENLLPDDIQNNLKDRLAELPLIPAHSLEFFGLLIGLDSTIYYLPSLGLHSNMRLKNCLLIKSFDSEILNLTESKEQITATQIDGMQIVLGEVNNSTLKTSSKPVKQTKELLINQSTRHGLLNALEPDRLFLNNKNIEGSKTHSNDQHYTSICLVSEDPIRVLVGGRNFNHIHFLSVDPSITEVVKRTEVVSLEQKFETCVMCLIRNKQNHGWILENGQANLMYK